MIILMIKILCTSGLMLILSLIKKRWGETVSGWVVALPLTSGPISYFIAHEQGKNFAAALATAALNGTVAQACFCIVYIITSRRLNGWLAFSIATAIFFTGGCILQLCAFSMLSQLGIILGFGILASSLTTESTIQPVIRASRWELPVNLLLANMMMITLTGIAPLLGPGASGLLTTFPVFATVLILMAYKNKGAAASRRVAHGMLLGMYGVVGFFFVLGLSLTHMELDPAFLSATIAALLVQGMILAIRPAYIKYAFIQRKTV